MAVSTSIGCSDTILKEEYINIGGPYAEIVLADSACLNIPELLTFTNTINVYDFQWTLSDGSVSDDELLYEEFNEFGVHKIYLFITGNELNTCTKIISDSVLVPILIADFVATDTIGCVPINVDFQNQSEGQIEFSWEMNDEFLTNESEFSYNFESSGSYPVKLMVLNQINCKDSAQKNIVIHPLPVVEISNDTLICSADTIQLIATGGEQYAWNYNGVISDTSIMNPFIYPEEVIVFTVFVTDSNKCINSDSVYINVQQKPDVLINNDSIINLIIGEEVELIAEEQMADMYYWTPDINISCSNCYSTYAKPFESTMYYFHAVDENNCFDITDSVLVNIEHKYSLDIPTAFTPNNDGKNDFIYVRGWGIKELVEFSVFDQFGKQVFHTSDIEQGWDGTMDLMNLDQGTYFYFVKALSYDSEVRSKSGSIYLIR